MKKTVKNIIGWLVGCITFLAINLQRASDGMYAMDGGATAALILAIAAAAATTGAAVYNGIQAKKSKRAADRTIGGLKAENASDYYADYYRGALDNDETRAYLKRLDTAMAKQNRSLDNSIVSSGATHENALAAKQGKNEVMSGAMAQAVQAEDARKRQLKDRYFSRNQQLALSQLSADQQYAAQKAQTISQIASGISQAAAAYGMYSGGGYGGGGSAPSAQDYANAKATQNQHMSQMKSAINQQKSNYLKDAQQNKLNTSGLGKFRPLNPKI